MTAQFENENAMEKNLWHMKMGVQRKTNNLSDLSSINSASCDRNTN